MKSKKHDICEVEKCFMHYLRCGLWLKEPQSCGTELSTQDLKNIYNLAYKQTCIGIVFDGLERNGTKCTITTKNQAVVEESSPLLPKNDEQWNKTQHYTWLKWVHAVSRIEQSNLQQLEILNGLFTLFQSNDINPILLKGQALAQYYINPLRRQCGDLDLYLIPSEIEKASQILQDKGIIINIGANSHKHHYRGNYKNFGIDLHFRLGSFLFNKQNKIWDKIISEKLVTNNCKIKVLETEINAIYIFNHLYTHLITRGIGLRQICDLARFLDKNAEKIDLEKLDNLLKEVKLKKQWEIIACLLVDHIGLSKNNMPFYNEKYNHKSLKILKLILYHGNFGFFDPKRKHNPKNKLIKKWNTLIFLIYHHSKIISIFPAVSFKMVFLNIIPLSVKKFASVLLFLYICEKSKNARKDKI